MSAEVFMFARKACAVCGVERFATELDEEHGEVPVYGWPPCPDHPDADAKDLCIWCGDPSHRCAVKGCQRKVEELANHGFTNFSDDEWAFFAVCDQHRVERGVISKHYMIVGSEADAKAFWADLTRSLEPAS